MRFQYAIGDVRRKPALATAALLCAMASAHGQSLMAFGDESEPPTERLRPQVRSEPLAKAGFPAVERQSIEPFLSAPQVFGPEQLNALPWIVGAAGQRSLLSKSDVVYARTPEGKGFMPSSEYSYEWNIYRNPQALKDPTSGALLGMEAAYLGRARLLKDERRELRQEEGKTLDIFVPASFEIVHAVGEIRAGDRLFRSNENTWRTLTPQAPVHGIAPTIISIYGSGIAYASKNQIIVVNQGSKQGLEPGQLMNIRQSPSLTISETDATYTALRPPPGVSGQALVFLTFDKLAYALIRESSEPVQVGDRLSSP